MELIYKNKRSAQEILASVQPAKLEKVCLVGEDSKNKLIFGNNIEVMQSLLQDYKMCGRIDLVYIDPPFSTNNVFKSSESRNSTISSRKIDEVAYSDKLKGNDFIEFLRERFVFIRELMSQHGSIYVHIDYKIGHYVKVIMDEIFGQNNFRNDITRIKCNPKNFNRKGYSNIKDLILFYTKSDDFIWNEPSQDMSDDDVVRLFSKMDKNGRRYTTTPLHAPGETVNGKTGKEWKGLLPPAGRHWRYDPEVLSKLDAEGLIEWSKTGNPRKIIYAEESQIKGKRLQDIWEFKDPQYPLYPTEKNIELIKTIIKTSSLPDNMIFDCFCGSGTTLVAANELKRNWIGIDSSKVAVKTTIQRLNPEKALFNTGADYIHLEQISDNNCNSIKAEEVKI